MPHVNVINELFVVAEPARIRAVVCDDDQWAHWLPGIVLTPYDDRGPLGVRWTMTGALHGTAEAWLQEHGDGTIVHAYLRGMPTSRSNRRRARSWRWVERHYVLPLKAGLLEAKLLLEGDRQPAAPRVPGSQRVVSASGLATGSASGGVGGRDTAQWQTRPPPASWSAPHQPPSCP